MSRVERTGRSSGTDTAKEVDDGAAKAKKPESVSGPGFAEALDQVAAATRANPGELDEILRRIDASAKALVERPSMAALAEFRDLVKSFLESVGGRAFQVATVPSVRFAENQKVFVISRKVDEALEALSADVLSGHATAVSLLARTDEIRGLLLDLRT